MIGPTQIWVAAIRFPSYGGFLAGRAARIVRHGQALVLMACSEAWRPRVAGLDTPPPAAVGPAERAGQDQ